MQNEAVLKWIAEQQKEWAAMFFRERVAYLRSRKIDTTGKLVRSMEYEVQVQALRDTSELMIAFEDYGRFIDMKKLGDTEPGQDMIEAIKQWARGKGIQTFKRTYLRRRKYLPRTDEQLLQSIAWGIAVNRSKGKRKRKRWYNKSKQRSVTELFDNVAAGLPDIVGPEIAKQLPNKV